MQKRAHLILKAYHLVMAINTLAVSKVTYQTIIKRFMIPVIVYLLLMCLC